MYLGNATIPYRSLFKNDSVPSILVQDHDFAEFEIARDARKFAQFYMPENLVTSERHADVVFVALWSYGLCMLNVSGHSRINKGWETQKGILAGGSCPEMQDAYTKIVESDRYQKNDGRDFVFIADKVSQNLKGDPGWGYKRLVWRSALLGVEERRLSDDRGSSRHLPVPYYVDPKKWYFETEPNFPLYKQKFIAYWGSRHVGEHCPACSNDDFDPKQVRTGIIDQIQQACNLDTSKECKIIVNEDSDDRNTLLDDLHFETSMQKSLFCPVPRGDSAATKRFYCAVAALCIPVLVSDHFPFPFRGKVDYNSFVIHISESDVASGKVDVFRLLANVDPVRIAKMQKAMEYARRDLLYTRIGSWPEWHKGRVVMNIMDTLRRMPACHDHAEAGSGEVAQHHDLCDRQVIGSWRVPPPENKDLLRQLGAKQKQPASMARYFF